MAFGDIRHGGTDGPLVTAPADPDAGPYYTEGKSGTWYGPFARWTEVQNSRDHMHAEWLREQASYAFQMGQGR